MAGNIASFLNGYGKSFFSRKAMQSLPCWGEPDNKSSLRGCKNEHKKSKGNGLMGEARCESQLATAQVLAEAVQELRMRCGVNFVSTNAQKETVLSCHSKNGSIQLCDLFPFRFPCISFHSLIANVALEGQSSALGKGPRYGWMSCMTCTQKVLLKLRTWLSFLLTACLGLGGAILG